MTTSVDAGVNKISFKCGGTFTGVTAVLARNGKQVFSFSAPITFTMAPQTYNFNAFVFDGP